ncbi:MAG: phosphate/phosphite/phosphonate ABC transporter substrate-binding protein [Magnetococcales bacterium]|nr:phosphate/phosphite/phosphonate ABC transporter substrate-binding protein [Magnetococcales bacterium]
MMLTPVVRLLLAGWLLVAGIAHGAGVPLTIGSISGDPAKEIPTFLPFAHYLAERLAPQGIGKGQVLVAASMREMADMLKNGRVDLFLESPLSSVQVNQWAGSKMILRRWKGGKADYRAVIFVKKESPIQELSQLAGQLVGFKDPFSSSSYLLPRIVMEQAGLSLVDMTREQGKVPEGKTGYLFTNDRETNLFWVIMGKTVAGAMSPEELDKQAKGDRDKLRVLHETFPIPRHVVNVRGDLPEPVLQALTQTLLGMDQDETGKQVLQKFEKTSRFDPIPPDVQARLQQLTPNILAILGNQP